MTKNIVTLFFIFAGFSSFSQIKSVEALRDSIKKIMAEEHMPGLSLALVHRDSTIWQGEGLVRRMLPLTGQSMRKPTFFG